MKKILITLLSVLCIYALVSSGRASIFPRERTIKHLLEVSYPINPEINFSFPTRGNRWWIQTVDAQGDVGPESSLALDSHRYPHISYFDRANYDLKYIRWNGYFWISDTIDAVGYVGKYTSIALDSNDRPHISYYNETDGGTDGHLKYIHFDGNQWNNVTIDTGKYTGLGTSISIDSNDIPHIAYHDWYKKDLKYAYINQTWRLEIIDYVDSVGGDPSIVLDSNNNPHISYHNISTGLEYARYNGTKWLLETVDSNVSVGIYTSIALDSNSNPHISYEDYRNDDLKYATHDGNQWHIETVDTVGEVGADTSIGLDSKDRVHISYYDNTNKDIKYALFDGNQWHIETIDSNGDVGWGTSIEIDNNDNPHISYYDATNGDLKYAVLDNIHPTLNSDNSPITGTTGDPYHFNISASDNHFVYTVHVNYRHGHLGSNLSLSKGDGDWLGNITLTDDPGNLSYTVYVKDMAGNYNISSRRNITILDNDRPSLVTDHSANAGTTGDNFIVTIEANDNVKVGAVYVNWSHGNSGGNLSLNGAGDFWSGIIPLEDNLTNMTYTVYVNDTSNNFNISSEKSVTVTDNDPPSIGGVGLGHASTGDDFLFHIAAYDNIRVVSAVVNWSHGRLGGDLELVESGNFWAGSIILDHAVTYLSYSIRVTDISNLSITSPRENIEVFDNDKPTFIKDKSTEVATTGDIFDFSMNATDNIGVSSVKVIYRFDNETERNNSMEKVSHDTWNFSISVPSNVTYLNYSYRISDDAGNNQTTDSFSFPVGDDDPPVAEAGENVTVDQHVTVYFNASGSRDNLGIANYSWSFRYEETDHTLYGMETIFTFDEAGIYHVTLNVTDFAGHGATDNFTIVVLDVTAPEADAGGNIEIDQGETVLFDGSTSGDNVGIVNYSWSFSYDGKHYILYGVNENFTFSIAGEYVITLLVVDAAGNQGAANFTVKVRDITPPRAVISIEDEVDQGIEVRLDASGSSDNVGIERYWWSFVYNGSMVELNGSSPVFTFDIPGTYNISLTVLDGASNTGAAHALLLVFDTERPVGNITANLSGIRVGDIVTLDGRNSTDNVGISFWKWTLKTPGGEWEFSASIKPFIISEEGEHSIILTVIDKQGNTDSVTRSFVVEPDRDEKGDTSAIKGGLSTIIAVGIVVLLLVGVVIFFVLRTGKKGTVEDVEKPGDEKENVEDVEKSGDEKENVEDVEKSGDEKENVEDNEGSVEEGIEE